ncbi:MAG: Fur family transcriptional regulator [Saccharofermentanales bacterium]|jgi:Fe2+ or Zn2+ uptake regulation protein
MNKSSQCEASEMLKRAGISPSYQRIMILSALLETDEHPSADTIYKKLGSNIPAISRATVYNTLNLLVDRGVIQSMRTAGSETRFDSICEAHSHFFCRKCKKIYDIAKQIGEIKTELDGHLVESQEFVYKGLCRKCREEMKK